MPIKKGCFFLNGTHFEEIKVDANIWSSWWFQIFFIFTPTWGNDPI